MYKYTCAYNNGIYMYSIVLSIYNPTCTSTHVHNYNNGIYMYSIVLSIYNPTCTCTSTHVHVILESTCTR